MDFSDPQFWLSAVTSLVMFILSLSVHEYAHARVAFALGDDTASRQGRMTLNPIPHIDPIGTILMPILGASGLPVIGWAKPVPVTPLNFTRRFSMRVGHALVAAAGPASNILLMIICVILYWVLFKSNIVPGLPDNITGAIMYFLLMMSWINVALAVFNMLPIPPLDGSRLLPRSLDGVMEVMQRYTFLIFIVIILFGRHIISVPILFIIDLIFGILGMDFRSEMYLSRTLAGLG